MDKNVKMSAEKLLTDKGKMKLFNAIKEYVRQSFIYYHSRGGAYEEYEKAEAELEAMIMALDWRLK